MKMKKTNFGKTVHMYSSKDEMEKQFHHDFNAFKDELWNLLEKFNLTNPYDHTIVSGALTDVLSWLAVTAEVQGGNIIPMIEMAFNMGVKNKRKILKELMKE